MHCVNCVHSVGLWLVVHWASPMLLWLQPPTHSTISYCAIACSNEGKTCKVYHNSTAKTKTHTASSDTVAITLAAPHEHFMKHTTSYFNGYHA